MAQQWFYKKDGTKHGPVTSQQLKQLAVSGELRPSDLVCREGREEWKPANAIKGLSNGDTIASSIGSPDVVSAATNDQTETDSLLHRVTTVVKKIGASAKSAALIATKQAELTKIQKVSLPSAYTSLGKEVYSAGSLRDHFQGLFTETEELKAKIAEVEHRASERPLSANLTDKAKAIGASAKDQSKIQTLRLQVSRVMTRLGQAAFERDGIESPELKTAIERHLRKANSLQNEIDALASNGDQRHFLPRRILFFFGGTLILVILFLGYSFLRSDSSSVSSKLDNSMSPELDGSESSSVADSLVVPEEPEPEWVEINGNQISTAGLPDYYKKKAPPVSRADYNVLRGGVLPQDVWEFLGGRPIKEGSDMETLDSLIAGSDFKDIHWRYGRFEVYRGNGGPESYLVLIYYGESVPPPLIKKYESGLK